MIVLEHHHVREVHAVRVGPAHEQRVLLDEAEARGGLTGAGHLAMPLVLSRHRHRRVRGRRHARRARQDVECRPLGDEDAAGGPRHARDWLLGLGLLRGDVVPLGLQPLDLAARLVEHMRRKRHTRQHALRLAQQHRVVLQLAHHKAANVPLGHVLSEPAGDLLLPGRRQDRRKRGARLRLWPGVVARTLRSHGSRDAEGAMWGLLFTEEIKQLQTLLTLQQTT
eukprot:scaffold3207_cov112-Isochrysis_galbana.AAC.5